MKEAFGIKIKIFLLKYIACIISLFYLISYFIILKNIDAKNYSAFYFNIAYIIAFPIFYFTAALIIVGLIKQYLFQKNDSIIKLAAKIGILLLLIYLVMLIYFFITNNYPLGFIILVNNPWLFIIPGILIAIGY
ncbi:hypothetical protein CLOM621_08888 [Clostridium sp. M62/1]|nr:hypothetical protein CLOM621_08888 [Clostridium sp. M62/1]